MRTIIAGSRGVTDFAVVEEAMRQAAAFGIRPSVVLSGTARGVDQLGERWANEHRVPVEHFAADWDRYGKSAGIIRNDLMARNADALVAVWDGQSRGTKHMIESAGRLGLRTLVIDPHRAHGVEVQSP